MLSTASGVDGQVLDFKASPVTTIGMELELQLLDADNLDLVDRIPPLLALLADDPNIKPEYIQNTVEINSDICSDLPQLEGGLTRELKLLLEKCRQLNVSLCGPGTYPFSCHLATITPNPQFRRMERTEGYISHTQITFATHVHLGMASGEEAIFMMGELKPYLPFLLALSASSPFWRGYDTEYESYRHRILAAVDRSDLVGQFILTRYHAGDCYHEQRSTCYTNANACA